VNNPDPTRPPHRPQKQLEGTPRRQRPTSPAPHPCLSPPPEARASVRTAAMGPLRLPPFPPSVHTPVASPSSIPKLQPSMVLQHPDLSSPEPDLELLDSATPGAWAGHATPRWGQRLGRHPNPRGRQADLHRRRPDPHKRQTVYGLLAVPVGFDGGLLWTAGLRRRLHRRLVWVLHA
jgi:hypothetical protein